MWKKILIFIAAAVVVFLAVVATRPADFKVERSATLPAPPAAVYAQVSDFGRWAAWSPWERLDPSMKKEVTGAPGTVGHAYHWVGNKQVGEGRMTIVAARPGAGVDIKLEFLQPWQATNATTLATAADGAGTRVTWTMTGTNNFMMKAMTLFMDMDKMVGGDFERGLANLKAASEEAARAAAPAAAAQ
jgi:hypothetical protein